MKRSLQGSFTVEATLIMPVIIFSIFALIFLSFYLHDKTRIQSTVDKALHLASLSLKHEGDLTNGRVDYENINDRGIFYLLFGNTEKEEVKIAQYLWQEFRKGLISADITDIEVKAGKREITIRVESDFKLPLQGVLEYFRPGQFQSLEVCGPVHNPAEAIRMSEVLLDTGKKVRGMDALMDKIDKIRLD